MNSSFEQEIRYKVLKLLSAQPNLSQRAVAGKLGISLGKTNYVLSELAEKGIIKMKRLKNAPQKIPYAYMLTPRGLEQKAKITARFLKQKLTEYEQIKTQIKEITQELNTDPKLSCTEATLKKIATEI
jgi:EPS-associated MarR family transcriptional regulator